MVYITKANAYAMVYKINVDLAIEMGDSYYKKPIKFITELDKKKLLVYKIFLIDPDSFLKSVYSKLKRETEHIYNNNHAYHNDVKCKNLLSDFTNIDTPDKLILEGVEAEFLFQQWCKERKKLFVEEQEKFKQECCKEFNLKEEEYDEVYIHQGNSGTELFINYNLEELEFRIDKIISAADEDLEIFLKKKDYEGTYPNFTSNRNILYRMPIMDLLKEWLRVSLNEDLKFEGTLLEQLGFVPCSRCTK